MADKFEESPLAARYQHREPEGTYHAATARGDDRV
jgi:hypothetical protein